MLVPSYLKEITLKIRSEAYSPDESGWAGSTLWQVKQLISRETYKTINNYQFTIK